jgi:hypothetical protein
MRGQLQDELEWCEQHKHVPVAQQFLESAARFCKYAERVRAEMKKRPVVPAKDIQHAFRKKTGEFVYLRISESSLKFLGMDTNFVYGITYNGNVTKVEPETLVCPMAIEDMMGNVQSERQWNRDIAGKDTF